MATTENKTILTVIADDAIKTVSDLKNNVAAYKQQLNEATIGSEQYATALTGLTKSQTMLKNAMYLTTEATGDSTAALKQLSDQADGVGESYNALVAQMASLKKQLRSTDVSTAEGMEKFKDLAGQINKVNNRLKEMDAAQGNYQRNVGMYTNKIKNLADGFLATAGGAASMVNPLSKATAGFKALSATPAVAILGILANIIMKVVQNIDSSEESTFRLKEAFAGFSVIGDLVTKGMQALGKAVAWVAEQFTAFTQRLLGVSEAQKQRIALTKMENELAVEQRNTIMANADAENKVAELRAKSAEKNKYSASERLKMLREAVSLEEEISKRSVDIAEREYAIIQLQNSFTETGTEGKLKEAEAYAKMVQAQTNYFNKTKELNAQIAEANKAAQAEAQALEAAERKKVDEQIAVNQKYWEYRVSQAEKGTNEEYNARLALLDVTYEAERRAAEQQYTDIDARHKAILLLTEKYNNDRIQVALDYADALEAAKQQELDAEKQAITDKKALMKQQVQIYTAAASAVSGILGSIADMYESDEENAEKNAEKIKALRIASATIDTISGAIAAYMGCQSLGQPWGAILGAIQAATVTAAGIANITKIKNTKVGSSSSSSSSSTSSLGAVVQAPSYVPQVSETTISTTAEQNAQLKEILQPQRVYILNSDLEAAANATKVQTAETSF